MPDTGRARSPQDMPRVWADESVGGVLVARCWAAGRPWVGCWGAGAGGVVTLLCGAGCGRTSQRTSASVVVAVMLTGSGGGSDWHVLTRQFAACLPTY